MFRKINAFVRFQIHLNHVDKLIMLLLPHYETGLFAKGIQLLDFRQSAAQWQWLQPFAVCRIVNILCILGTWKSTESNRFSQGMQKSTHTYCIYWIIPFFLHESKHLDFCNILQNYKHFVKPNQMPVYHPFYFHIIGIVLSINAQCHGG